MSTRYGDRGHGRYGDPEEARTEDRDYAERDTSRHSGESARGAAGERYGREYGATRRGGYAPPRGGGDYGGGREREYGSRDYFARDYGSRRGAGDYGPREYGSRYGREAGGYAGSGPARRYEGEEYGRGYAPRAYGRDAGRDRLRAARMEGGRAKENQNVRLPHQEHAPQGRAQGRPLRAGAQGRAEAGRRFRALARVV